MSAPPTSLDDRAVEEARLVACIAAGDRAAFRDLYARYSGPLFSVAMRMLHDHGAAEEALQDTFLKLWRHASSFDPQKARPFTWALTITRRTCIDQLRKLVRRPETESLSAPDTSLDLPTPENIRHSAERHDDAARLQNALAALPENQRRALDLALFSGFTHPQIAEALRQPIGSVKTWIRRGLLQLRDTLNLSAP